MTDQTKMTLRTSYPDGGPDVVKEFNAILNIRDFVGTPGFPLLLVAANVTNKRVTAYDIRALLLLHGRNYERPVSRIRKYRWLFRQPGTSNNYGGRADLDGKAARAIAIMRANRSLSLRDLAKVLKEHGIDRKREWIRMHRCG